MKMKRREEARGNDVLAVHGDGESDDGDEHVMLLFHYYYTIRSIQTSNFRRSDFGQRRLSIIIAWNVTALRLLHTFECKIIRNVYVAHHYPSAIRHPQIAAARFFLASLAPRFFFFFFFLWRASRCIVAESCACDVLVHVRAQFWW